MSKAGTAFWSRRTAAKGSTPLPVPTQDGMPAEQPIEMVSQERPAASGVNQRRAFFEAMIRSNSDTFVSCAKGSSSAQPTVFVSKVQPASRASWMHAPNPSNEPAEQDYNEVQLTFRMPKHDGPSRVSAAAPVVQLNDSLAITAASGRSDEIQPAPLSPPGPLSPQQLSHAHSETVAALQLELERKESQRLTDAARLKRKSEECENLTRVVRELAQGRAKLVAGRAVQAERLAELHHQYERVLKVSDLSRSLSKENMAKAAQAEKQLQAVEEEVVRQKRLVAYLKERAGRLSLDNLEAQERIKLLERLPLFQCQYGRESACMLEFTTYKVRETY